jgi:hypothetical protein
VNTRVKERWLAKHAARGQCGVAPVLNHINKETVMADIPAWIEARLDRQRRRPAISLSERGLRSPG